MQKRWIFGSGEPAVRDRLSHQLGVTPLIGQLLANRGFIERDEADSFLWPKLTQLHDPELLSDMSKAVGRIRSAVKNREKIVIYGDYDVDGTTGSAVLLKFFEQVDYPAESYIPHRVEEGYGLNMDAVKKLAESGMNLMITVDCGTKASEPIRFLQEKGIDVVVTDHHLADELPPAYAIINPSVEGSEYPFMHLAGSGVAFKLAWALSQSFSNQKKVSPEFREYLLTALGFVALGTVADVVPLLGENRILARFGLTALRESKSPGILALSEKAGLQNRKLRASDVSFRLAPRLNAAGRMGHARETLELLMINEEGRAFELASALEDQNKERKKLVETMFKEAREMVEAGALNESPVIVLSSPDWHVGVMGIVASRIIETYRRPCIVMALNGNIAKGSARSIRAYHITEAISTCSDLLISFGGHSQAAGVQIESDRIPEFRSRLVEHAEGILTEEDFAPVLEVDSEVLLAQLSPQLVRDIESLEPFGEQNPEPVLVATGLAVAGVPKVMGSQGNHISFIVRQGEMSLRAVGFGMAAELKDVLESGVRCSLAFTPTINEFRGKVSVELMLKDVHLLPDG